ncbi:MAG: hypothetical protein KAJ19_23070 [Gammaproteobacteria bacterium]|nr:hypothetical protein [Gammaproteobacteria bacterium]
MIEPASVTVVGGFLRVARGDDKPPDIIRASAIVAISRYLIAGTVQHESLVYVSTGDEDQAFIVDMIPDALLALIMEAESGCDDPRSTAGPRHLEDSDE